MTTAESVKSKLQGLIDTANATTGNADADLTAAVNALVAGFGQGGGGGLPGNILEIKTGSWTQATNDSTGSFTIPHGCSKNPLFVIVDSDYATSGATINNSVQLLAAVSCIDGTTPAAVQYKNVGGAGMGHNITWDDTNLVFSHTTGGRWRQGNTYTWYAIVMKD